MEFKFKVFEKKDFWLIKVKDKDRLVCHVDGTPVKCGTKMDANTVVQHILNARSVSSGVWGSTGFVDLTMI